MKFYCRLDKEDEDRKNFLADQKTMKAGKNHAKTSSELSGKYMDHSRNLGDVIAVTLLILSKAKLR